MQYRKINKNGDELSILGFGCMRLPQKTGFIDEKRAMKQLRYAIDNGVNYVDTAMPYHMGASETFLGRALADGYRDKVKIATKLTLMFVDKQEDMDKILNMQLKKLNVEYIDYYLLHGIDGKSWEKYKEMNVFEFLDRAKKEGKIINTGFSFHGDKDVFKEIVDSYDWEMCQIQYNFLDEYNQAGTEGLEYAASKNLGVIIMEPLRGGNLTKKVPPDVQKIYDEAEIKRSPAEWALRWVWDHPEVAVVLSGMNREEHVEENIKIANEARSNSLTDRELDIVKRVGEKYKSLMKVECTGCRYCMPCPSGVDIPVCFEIYNDKYIYNDKATPGVFYLMRLGDSTESGQSSFASQCKECGQCLEKCPQNIEIIEKLKDVANEFEGTGMKIMRWIMKTATGFAKKRVAKKASQAD